MKQIIFIAMPMYSLMEHINIYSDIWRSLWKFKRDDVSANNANLSIANSNSFKYKAPLVEKTANAVNNTNRSVKNTKIAAPLTYLRNFCRSLTIPLIDCNIHLELNWIDDSILSTDKDSLEKCEIIDAKLHIPTVTLRQR